MKLSDQVCVQPRFRSMWERYCRGVQAIVYVVDSADPESLEQSKHELHELLDKPSLAGVPVLLLGNKNDLDGALSQAELIDRLDLKVMLHADTCLSQLQLVTCDSCPVHLCATSVLAANMAAEALVLHHGANSVCATRQSMHVCMSSHHHLAELLSAAGSQRAGGGHLQHLLQESEQH